MKKIILIICLISLIGFNASYAGWYDSGWKDVGVDDGGFTGKTQDDLTDGTTAKQFVKAEGTTLPATCTATSWYFDTDSDDCADTAGGAGTLCYCKTTNTWVKSTGSIAGMSGGTVNGDIAVTENISTSEKLSFSSAGKDLSVVATGYNTPVMIYDSEYSIGSSQYSYRGKEYDGLWYSGTYSNINPLVRICCGINGRKISTIDFSAFGGGAYFGTMGMGVSPENILYISVQKQTVPGVGEAKLLACNNKAAGGDPNYCDNTLDFVTSAMPVTNQNKIWDVGNHKGHMYVAAGGMDDNTGVVMVCHPERGGASSTICDDAGDWDTAFTPTTGSTNVFDFANWGDVFYLTSIYDGDDHMWYCDADVCGTSDWTSAYHDESFAYDGFLVMESFSVDDCLYAGTGDTDGATTDDVYKCCETDHKCATGDWTKIYDGSNDEIASMAEINGDLWFTSGVNTAPDAAGLYKLNATQDGLIEMESLFPPANTPQRIFGLIGYQGKVCMSLEDIISGADMFCLGNITEITPSTISMNTGTPLTSLSLINMTADLAITTIYTIAEAGFYEFSAYLNCTSNDPDTASPLDPDTIDALTFTYQDKEATQQNIDLITTSIACADKTLPAARGFYTYKFYGNGSSNVRVTVTNSGPQTGYGLWVTLRKL